MPRATTPSWSAAPAHPCARGTGAILPGEGNHYFPAEWLPRDHFRASDHHSLCPWKGTASYYDVVVGDEVIADAAWYYPQPKDAAKQISGRVAFWRGVDVVA